MMSEEEKMARNSDNAAESVRNPTHSAPNRREDMQTRCVAGIRSLGSASGKESRAMSDENSQERFELSFSSETPYRRYDWWLEEDYDEILDHSDDAVDLTRLRDMGVVLYNHQRDAVIGRVLDVSISDKRGVATIEFDGDEQSQIIADKVRNGTLRGVSVAYSIDKTERVQKDDETPKLYIRHWTPMEISIVSIPADTTVGVGRSADDGGMSSSGSRERGGRNMGSDMTRETLNNGAEERQHDESHGAQQNAGSGAEGAQAQQDAPQRSADDILREERQRISDITSLCSEFGVDAARYIDDGSTLDQVRAAVLEQLRTRGTVYNAQVTHDESDKFRAAASDALMMRAGMAVAKPADGARDLRGMSLRDLMIESIERDGGEAAREARSLRMRGASELFDKLISSRAYFSPTAAFPSILDQTINKAYTQGYQLAQTTFEMWTQRGTLSDFKRTQSQWRRGDAGELLLVPEGGELKHDVPTDEKMGGRELHTYGRQFTMTREAFINDDIGFLTSLPSRYATSTKLTLNRQVYQVLAGNPTLEDGHELFGSEHGNLASAGALNLPNLVAAMEAMTTQRNARNQIIQVRPQFLIVPTGLGAYARMLLGSSTITTTALSSSATEMQVSNPVQNALQVVEDPELLAQLGSGGKYAWFLAANTATVDTIQVDYLNGVDTPTIRRMETPGQLGFVWDIYMDWGISVLDWRGLYKNPGAQPAAL